MTDCRDILDAFHNFAVLVTNSQNECELLKIKQPPYMHTCIHAYMHTCIHAYIHAYMHTCIHS